MSCEFIVGRWILKQFSQGPCMLINMSVFVDLFQKWRVTVFPSHYNVLNMKHFYSYCCIPKNIRTC